MADGPPLADTPAKAAPRRRVKRAGRPKGARTTGWRVERRGRAWIGFYRAGGKYVSRSFDREVDAQAWAKREAARIAAHRHLVSDGAPVTETARLIEGYLADLVRRGRRTKTVLDAKAVLERWQADVPRLNHAALAATELWLDRCSSTKKGQVGQPLSPRTRNRYRVTLTGLVAWARKRRLIPDDPLLGLEAETTDKHLRPQFSLDELRTIVRSPGHRIWARACLMVLGGLRHQEAVHLRWRDVDLAGGVLLLRESSGAQMKRRRERIVPIQPELRLVLDWMGGGVPEDAIAGAAHDVNTSRSFGSFLAHAGVPANGRSGHSLRHAYAGLMTATGVPSLLLKAYMGHETTATTAIYTELAARYATAVGDWKRGEFELFRGWASQMKW